MMAYGVAFVVLAACNTTARSPVEATKQAGYDALANARVVEIRQSSAGCAPRSIDVERGETILLHIVNQTDSEYRFGVLDGSNDLTVPANGASSTYYGVPTAGPTLKLRCYVKGGVSTTIDVVMK